MPAAAPISEPVTTIPEPPTVAEPPEVTGPALADARDRRRQALVQGAAIHGARGRFALTASAMESDRGPR